MSAWRARLGAGIDPVVVTALVGVNHAVVHFPGGGGDGIQEPAVVSDHHDGNLAAQQLRKPLHALDVEVVGRLVEYHEVEFLYERCG